MPGARGPSHSRRRSKAMTASASGCPWSTRATLACTSTCTSGRRLEVRLQGPDQGSGQKRLAHAVVGPDEQDLARVGAALRENAASRAPEQEGRQERQ